MSDGDVLRMLGLPEPYVMFYMDLAKRNGRDLNDMVAEVLTSIAKEGSRRAGSKRMLEEDLNSSTLVLFPQARALLELASELEKVSIQQRTRAGKVASGIRDIKQAIERRLMQVRDLREQGRI